MAKRKPQKDRKRGSNRDGSTSLSDVQRIAQAARKAAQKGRHKRGS